MVQDNRHRRILYCLFLGGGRGGGELIDMCNFPSASPVGRILFGLKYIAPKAFLGVSGTS